MKRNQDTQDDAEREKTSESAQVELATSRAIFFHRTLLVFESLRYARN
jgi:hypothetical protein